MITRPKPALRPSKPFFSSGPTIKRPGWSPQVLEGAVLGRSHRSKHAKAKIMQTMDLARQILGLPDDYLIGIVPGSDTGAVEIALWSMLGARGVDVLAWESFGKTGSMTLSINCRLVTSRCIRPLMVRCLIWPQ